MKELLFKNLSLKILALASALVFWFIVLGLQNAPREFETPLEVKPFNLSEQYTVVGALPYAKVRILADKDVQQQLQAKDFEVYLDLKSAEPGKLTSAVYVTSKNPKVTIVSVAPESITLMIEKKSQKEVMVEYEVIGKVKDGFQLKNVKIDPERVTLLGAGSTLSAIKKVKVLIPLTGTESRPLTLSNVGLVDQAGKPLEGVKTSPESIDAFVDIASTQQEKVVPVKPKFTGVLKNGFISKMTMQPSTVNIVGDIKVLESLTGLETEPIDLDKVLKSGVYVTNLILPREIRVATGNRVEVVLEITDVK